MSGFDDIPQQVKDNYEQLIAERGWTHEQAAEQYATADPRLASYLRSVGTPDRTAAPKGRRGRAAAQVTAAGAGADPADGDPASTTPPAV